MGLPVARSSCAAWSIRETTATHGPHSCGNARWGYNGPGLDSICMNRIVGELVTCRQSFQVVLVAEGAALLMSASCTQEACRCRQSGVPRSVHTVHKALNPDPIADIHGAKIYRSSMMQHCADMQKSTMLKASIRVGDEIDHNPLPS